jgi:hypothetical protein
MKKTAYAADSGMGFVGILVNFNDDVELRQMVFQVCISSKKGVLGLCKVVSVI